MAAVPIHLDRAAGTPLATQIYRAVREAIETGRLDPGASFLPGVTWPLRSASVRVAYQRLIDEQFAVGAGAAGTRVAEGPSPASVPLWSPDVPPMPELFNTYGTPPMPFQMGVPSQDAFPFKLWSRVFARAVRRAAAAPLSYPDRRGDPQLRKEIAAYALAGSVTYAPAWRRPQT